jgi:2-polyprenyl-3-methyl-5-hydroxy-6-metoxy-1,4-benzoquinol methylase
VSDPGADLTAFYEAGYTQADPERAALLGRWRALGAESKASHVVELLRRAEVRPQTLVEIGCGDGALLQAMAAAGVARTYDGFELSGPAAAIAAERAIPGVGRIEAYDGARVPAGDGAYDLAVVSHVLEHVLDPPALLAEAARVGRRVLVEVPLEANRSARRPAKVADARSIGHIQAFSREAIAALGAGAGLEIVADLSDPLPRRHHAFFAPDARAQAKATAKWAVRAAAWRAAPRRAERWFTMHYAALLAPR